MPDYKDIITGTIDRVVDKMKDYTDGKSARELYEEGLQTVSGYGKRAVLAFDVAGAKEQAKETFAEIGKLYYEKTKNAPEQDFAELFETIDSLRTEIQEKQNQIDEIKNRDYSADKDIEVDIIEYGEVVDNYENKD